MREIAFFLEIAFFFWIAFVAIFLGFSSFSFSYVMPSSSKSPEIISDYDPYDEAAKATMRDKAVIEACSKETAVGIRSSLNSMDFSNLSAEDKARATLEISGTYSAFFTYCVRFYEKQNTTPQKVSADNVLMQFIANGYVGGNNN